LRVETIRPTATLARRSTLKAGVLREPAGLRAAGGGKGCELEQRARHGLLGLAATTPAGCHRRRHRSVRRNACHLGIVRKIGGNSTGPGRSAGVGALTGCSSCIERRLYLGACCKGAGVQVPGGSLAERGRLPARRPLSRSSAWREDASKVTLPFKSQRVSGVDDAVVIGLSGVDISG
jgi:hypothetical protein